MQNKFCWKIGGEAGFGIMTIGLLMSKIASRLGYHIFDYFEYPSLIRGGHNTYEVLISDQPVHAPQQQVDFLMCLNKDTYEFHKHRLSENSVVVYDDEEFEIEETRHKLIKVPFKRILREEQASMVMLNNVALGVCLAVLGWQFSILEKMIEDTFGKKGQHVIKKNIQVARRGYDLVVKEHRHFLFKAVSAENKLVMTGNDMFSLASIVADCRMYAAYPMTPSSTVLTSMASWAQKAGIVVRHAEDEISVINTALGASFAGVRSSVGTSGGGFALMVEALSFAGVAEMGVVLFLSQRPGPATGLPTWTEQGDLLFAVHAGHGEFPKIVLAPGDIEETHELTLKAYDLADIYQTPVIIMSDKFLSESHQSISKLSFDLLNKSYTPNRGKIVTKSTQKPYQRYALSSDGISEHLLPGQKGVFYQANSYEHLEDGHTTEEALPRKQQVDKRARKLLTYLTSHFEMPEIFGSPENSDIVFVSWGSTKGPILEAIKTLKQQGKDASYIHFTHVYPLDEQKIADLFKNEKRYILIENNSEGQFGKLLRQQTGVYIKEKFLKYDGRPIWPEEVVKYVNYK